MDFLYKIKKKYNIGYLGASVQDISQMKLVMKYQDLKIVQIPFNILDYRWNSIVKKNKEKKIIHVRSIFLQGLLLSNKIKSIVNNKGKDIDISLNIIKNKFQIEKTKSLLINYVYSFRKINAFIFGIDNINQFQEINSLIANIKTFNLDEIIQIQNIIPKVNENILNPSLWKKKC